MNYLFFILKRLSFGSKNDGSPSVKIFRISTIIAVVCFLSSILSIAIVNGFQKEVTNKVHLLSGQIRISGFEISTTKKNTGINLDSLFSNDVSAFGIKRLQNYVLKQAVIKTDEFFQGVIVKGIDSTFNPIFYENVEFEGKKLSGKKHEIVVSKIILKKLGLKLGQEIIFYFPDGMRVRRRKFKIVGTFKTGFKDFDDYYVLAHIGDIRQLNGWEKNMAEGVEVFLQDNKIPKRVNDQIYRQLRYNYRSKTMEEIYPEIYHWLKTLDLNTVIIITLMLTVCIISTVSFFIILILDRLYMIGILKVLGSSNRQIIWLFTFLCSKVILRAALLGNIIAGVLMLLLEHSKLIPLDSEVYLIDHVPASISFWNLLKINVLIILSSYISILGVAYFTLRLSPSKILKFQ